MIHFGPANNWKFVTELDGEIVLTFANSSTAKEKAIEEGDKIKCNTD